MQVIFCFDILDNSYVAECEVTITHRSTVPKVSGPPEYCDPGEGCEWQLETALLYRDADYKLPQKEKLECPDWLLEAINSSSAFDEAVQTAEQDEDYGPDPDAEHDRRSDRDRG